MSSDAPPSASQVTLWLCAQRAFRGAERVVRLPSPDIYGLPPFSQRARGGVRRCTAGPPATTPPNDRRIATGLGSCSRPGGRRRTNVEEPLPGSGLQVRYPPFP